MNTLMHIAEHRNSLCLNIYDVLEAARILGVNRDLPPRPEEDFVDSQEFNEWKILDSPHLWENNDWYRTNDSEPPEFRKILSLCDFNRTNAHGLCCLSRCTLLKHSKAAEMIVNRTWSLDLPIVASNLKGLQRDCKMFDEFLGWSPIFW
jgi:hypothetical protein